ncbi:MAG: hypothetical protein E6H70_01290 [Betaproteobacteria bacterium]|nr:MAG: hypothetical protein E6H70_01290 [Betaproteobacteria bacterium]
MGGRARVRRFLLVALLLCSIGHAQQRVEVPNAEGWHALVLDSLTPRGEKELCTRKYADRSVTQVHRRRDALGALQWRAARPDVDAQRIALLGWSHGGSAVLATTEAADFEVRAARVKPHAAVAFYPGCADALKARYRPAAPLLLLVGANDDWTAPQPCERLAQGHGGLVQIEVYPDAYHGFDGTAPVRLRADVPNGVNPGRGVHVGGDAAAAAASRQRLLSFLHEQLDGAAR